MMKTTPNEYAASASKGRAPTLLLASSLLALVALSGCSKPPTPAAAPRPVRVAQVAEYHAAAAVVFAGEVRARYESKIGFRVGGKIVRRAVNVGDRLKAGQLIAELDATDYRLGADAIDAQLRAARSEHQFAMSDLRRYRELLDEKLVGSAEYERRETSVSTLKDRVAALTAQFEQARRQTQYTRLLGDHASVVVALPAEAGQVVAAGQPVAVLARTSELDVAIDVPEDQRARVMRGSPARVRFWAAPGTLFEGRVREVAASADAGARTYAVRISLPRRPSWVQIGMSATAAFAPADPSRRQVVPLSAVFVPQAETKTPQVWALRPDNTVHGVPVEVGAPVGSSEVQVSGLPNGLTIVTAGASRLHEGQAVSVLAPYAIGGSLASRAPRGPSTTQNASAPSLTAALRTEQTAP
jgi:membrane fusion protein, multidrug efflux system